MPGSGEEFYVLQDPFNKKHLLPATFYKNYGFEIGQFIACRVDKINCTGKIFLEPKHPLYQEGKIYEFQLVENHYKQSQNDTETCPAVIVRDRTGQKILLEHRAGLLKGSTEKSVKARVERIKKGSLFLSNPADKNAKSNLKQGESYFFTIVSEKNIDGEPFFVLSDTFENKYLLKKKYYSHYGLKKNQNIRCTVSKYSSEGQIILEPENPVYKTGEVYRFPFVRLEKTEIQDNRQLYLKIVRDKFGRENRVFPYLSIKTAIKKDELIACKVVRIKKSRLFLHDIET